MKVKELIRELTFHDLDAEVIVNSEATGEMPISSIRQVTMEPEDQGYIDEEGEEIESDPTHQVHIEV